MAMKSAFCCASLRTGTLVIGWALMAWLLLGSIAVFYLQGETLEFKERTDSTTTHRPNTSTTDAIWPTTNSIIKLLIKAIDLTVLVCLLYGTYKERRGFLVPFLIFYGTDVVLRTVNIISVIYWMFKEPEGMYWPELLISIIMTPMFIYFMYIVGSLYIQLNPQNREHSTNEATFVNKP